MTFSACTNVPFTTIAHGNHSGVEDVIADVFRLQEDFDQLWKIHSNQYPLPDCPIIDFDTNMVVALFITGNQSHSDCTTINMTSMEENETEIIITGEVSDCYGEKNTYNEATQPHHIVSMKKSDKPIRFKIKKVRYPIPAPYFILAFKEGANIDTYVKKIKENKAVKNVYHMQALGIVNVIFDPYQITAYDANIWLLCINETSYVYEAPPIINEDKCYQDDEWLLT